MLQYSALNVNHTIYKLTYKTEIPCCPMAISLHRRKSMDKIRKRNKESQFMKIHGNMKFADDNDNTKLELYAFITTQ